MRPRSIMHTIGATRCVYHNSIKPYQAPRESLPTSDIQRLSLAIAAKADTQDIRRQRLTCALEVAHLLLQELKG